MTPEASQSDLPEAEGRLALFERLLMPHLNAAYNLARWLTRDDQNAQDVVQEAYLRAFKSFDGFRGGKAGAWLLTIVRNTCYTWLRQNQPNELTTSFDEEMHGAESHVPGPEALLAEKIDRERLANAIESLPLRFREVIVMREVEGLAYPEIASTLGVPAGTVMSRLKRARRRLRQLLAGARGSKAEWRPQLEPVKTPSLY